MTVRLDRDVIANSEVRGRVHRSRAVGLAFLRQSTPLCCGGSRLTACGSATTLFSGPLQRRVGRGILKPP